MGSYTNQKLWSQRWDARMLEIEPILIERNEILPKKNWVLTSVKNQITSQRINPVITEWAEEYSIPISFGEIEMLDSHKLTTMKFEAYEHLVLFKLRFEGANLPEM